MVGEGQISRREAAEMVGNGGARHRLTRPIFCHLGTLAIRLDAHLLNVEPLDPALIIHLLHALLVT